MYFADDQGPMAQQPLRLDLSPGQPMGAFGRHAMMMRRPGPGGPQMMRQGMPQQPPQGMAPPRGPPMRPQAVPTEVQAQPRMGGQVRPDERMPSAFMMRNY